MKIAFVFGSMHRGGAERVIASLANTFCSLGDEVSIVTLDNEPSGYALDSKVKHIRLDIYGNSKNKLEALRRNMKLISKFRKCVLREKYDAVIAFDLRHALFLQGAVPFFRKFKIIASERANPNVRVLGKIEKVFHKYFLPKVDGFVFQTERVSQCYCETLRNKGTVIHNGVFPEILPQKVPEFADRRHSVICAVGRLDEQKGYDVLLEAFSRFAKKHPQHTLEIYGEGPLRKQLEQQIIALGLQDWVTLHGSVPNVMFEVADAGMFVMASRFEGMPNALMEALACGIPCVCTDCDFGPDELITNGENGMLVPVDDAGKLYVAMDRIASDWVLAERLSHNAPHIRATHSGERIASLYHQYITKIVSGN